jgi:hypothetical protein
MSGWVAGAVVVGGLGSALISSNAASNASDAQANSANQANATQQQQYNQTRTDNLPWMNRGNAAGDALQQQLGIGADNGTGNYGALTKNFTNADFVADPGYQFRLDQGMRGVNASLAAKGGLLSGAAVKAAANYNQGFASNEFGQAYNRFVNNQSNTYNKLAGVAGTGQTANSLVGSLGQQTANNIANNQIGVGNARASGYIAQGNALTNGISTGFNAYQNANALNRLAPQQTSTPYQDLTYNGQVLGGTSYDPAYG